MRFHCTVLRIASHHNKKEQKKNAKKYLWGCGERTIVMNFQWENKLVQPLGQYAWNLLKKEKRKKSKLELLCDPTIALLEIPKESNADIASKHLHIYASCWTIHNSQKWITKMRYTYTMGFYTASKKQNNNNCKKTAI